MNRRCLLFFLFHYSLVTLYFYPKIGGKGDIFFNENAVFLNKRQNSIKKVVNNMSVEQAIIVEVIDSISTILPFQIEKIESTASLSSNDCITVKIDTIGDYQSTIVLKGNNQSFNEIGKTLYGMELDEEMLHSFAGELWNMILGGIMRTLGKKGIEIDITPPSILEEDPVFSRKYQLNVHFHDQVATFFVYINL
jgi:chemotaxis protein CheX